MNLETLAARILPLAALAAAVAAFLFVLLLAAQPADASVGPRRATVASVADAGERPGAPAEAVTPAGPVLNEAPRCTLDVTQDKYGDGDVVRASLHLANPAPASAEVEMKIWFSAPGEPPLSLADPMESGRTLELPAMLNRDSGHLKLFSVDATTPRGTYEMNCRLIDPVTGSLLSEDLNAFQIQ